MTSTVSEQTTGAHLRQVMRHWTTGVTVITTQEMEDRRVGIVSNSFTSVSLDPPLVSWAIDKGSSSFEVWNTTDAYSVHILADDQANLVQRFAQRGVDKFAGLETATSRLSTPVIDEVDVRLDCRVVGRHEAGDHVILIGEVLDHRTVDTLSPLTNRSL